MSDFTHVKKACQLQCKVRECEIEGIILDMESDLVILHSWGFLSSSQYQECLDILRGRKPGTLPIFGEE